MNPLKDLLLKNKFFISNTYQVEDELVKNISKVKLGAVTDVSDQFVMLNIKGTKVFDLFATGSPFNFNDFKTKNN